ncbi:hypothetical protein ABZ953_35115 [Streptomyces sp. NPDC046465]|uniref:hypothetical protein n=1 Tax=Streptomyces sp. NPDC046465 TaxID=3155810 RepID=UPI0033D0899E
MMIVLLSIAVLVAAAGLGAVVWAARGGPRWVRGVAKATTVTAEVVASVAKSNRRRNRGFGGSSSGSDGGGDSGS